MAALHAQGQSPRAISRNGVDSTSGSLVLMDAALTQVTRALTYNAGGFIAEAAQIATHAPGPHFTLAPASALARMVRLMAEDTGHRAVHLLHQADFIAAKLMVRRGWSDDNNTLKTSYDPETGRWPDWFADLGLASALLPQVAAAGAPL